MQSAANFVALSWTTQSETALLGFQVYRSEHPEIAMAQPQIPIGNNKQIIWRPAVDNMEIGTNYKVKLIARDNPNPGATQETSFIKVDGGTFYNGSSNVTVSSFFIYKYELTQSEYQAVMGVLCQIRV